MKTADARAAIAKAKREAKKTGRNWYAAPPTGYRVTIDGRCLCDSVSPVLLNSYILEQCKLNGWRVLATGPDGSGGRVLDLLDKGGCLHVLTACPL